MSDGETDWTYCPESAAEIPGIYRKNGACVKMTGRGNDQNPNINVKDLLISETFSLIMNATQTHESMCKAAVKWRFRKGMAALQFDLFDQSVERHVTLCGTNFYPNPMLHVDRVMDEHDIMYIYDGQWQVTQDGVNYRLLSGDVMLLHAGSHHYGIVPCTPNMRNMFVHFNRLPSDRTGVDLSPVEARAYASGNTLCVPTVVHTGTDSTVASMLQQIIGMYWSHRDDRERTLTVMLAGLLNELAYLARNSLAQSEEWLTVLLKAMSTEPERTLSLEEAAELVHMSVRTLSARFRRIMGRSVHEYQLDMKLEGTYNALRTGHYTVREVAQNFGFCDAFYFSRVFKQKFGIAPSELKRREPSANINRPEMR